MSPFHLYSMCLNKHSVGGEGPYYFFKHCEISRSPVDSSNLLHPSNFICRPALLWQEAVRWPVPCVQTLTPDEVTPNTRCKLYLVNTPLSSSALQLLQFFRVAAEAADCAAWPCRLHGHQAAAAALPAVSGIISRYLWYWVVKVHSKYRCHLAEVRSPLYMSK